MQEHKKRGMILNRIEIESVIMVNAPIEECFTVWSDLEYLPWLIPPVTLAVLQDNRIFWHWKMVDIQGEILQWDSVVDAIQADRCFSWHSLPHENMNSSGSIRLEEEGSAVTRITLEIVLNKPDADSFYQPLKKQIDMALHNFKTFIEQHVIGVLGAHMPHNKF
jgi:uncharacterized membrane protein